MPITAMAGESLDTSGGRRAERLMPLRAVREEWFAPLSALGAGRGARLAYVGLLPRYANLKRARLSDG